jgi:HSP20 family protein
MERLQHQMNRLFTDTFADVSRAYAPEHPTINVWTNPEGAVVTAELPGVDPEDIDISVVGETLTLHGSRKLEEVGDVKYHRQERGYGKFTRTFELPFNIEADKVEARLEKGILHIFLPRAEVDKPKKITVKTS